MNIEEFIEALKTEFKVVLLTPIGDDLVVTVKPVGEAVHEWDGYMVGTYKEAMDCGYPVDGLMNVTREMDEAVSLHMSIVSKLEAELRTEVNEEADI